MKTALLMSSSRMGAMGYLEHADAQIHTILQKRPLKVLFVPFAGVSFSFDAYEAMVRPVFERLGYEFASIHQAGDPRAAVAGADAIAVGGGNTFALLKRMYDAGIVELIKARVAHEGVPYIGWSAGTNVAIASIRTTNDMPIVQPPTFRGIGLTHFQINPHFIPGKPAGHNGESREERLQEFLTINPGEHVVAIKEGTALLITGDKGRLLGEDALWFKDPATVEPIRAGAEFDLSMIKGGA